jgi:hypothetical protein
LALSADHFQLIIAYQEEQHRTALGEPMQQPVTRYAKSGDVHIAYQTFGNGSVNLVLAPPFVSNVENYWEEPDLARWLERQTRPLDLHGILDLRQHPMANKDLPRLGLIDSMRAMWLRVTQPLQSPRVDKRCVLKKKHF